MIERVLNLCDQLLSEDEFNSDAKRLIVIVTRSETLYLKQRIYFERKAYHDALITVE
jgi:hypothetical protein